ncbi:MAG TPA: glycosyltransferase [Bryobacteraceae bacterium]|jgi:glycosyltransferase involved in cell wall biosynthesis|nr:glycosyltransferase [Bryobacteraceae bacterium]
MSKVALVSHDVQTIHGRAGGVGAFVTHFGRLLRKAGEEVTIILTRQETHPVHIDDQWRRTYEDCGIGIVELHNSEARADRWADSWTVRLAEQVTPLLAGFDIAYFQDWANMAFHAARVKRFSPAPLPILVTVLHGPSAWIAVGNRRYPEIPEDLHLGYVERYAAQHSDFVVSPSRYMLGWARDNGWEFRREPAVLGLPYLDAPLPGAVSPPAAVSKLISFGRLETRKGTSLLIAALHLLRRERPEALRSLTEIVLLGAEQETGTVQKAQRDLGDLGVPVRHMGDFDSDAAREFLAESAADSLVVIPSPVENFPYAAIEASRIPGLRILCSRGGGTPEIFGGHNDAPLFDAHPAGLAEKLSEALLSTKSRAAAYDAESANARWLEFHRSALAGANAPRATQAQPATVDVCIPNYNSSAYLSQLLKGLEQQTARKFGVIAIDDGSCAADRAMFQALAARYRERAWRFVTQANSFVDAARNRAAALSAADYVLFVDADDFPAPGTIERLLQAITYSGDDCLLAGGVLFEGDASPYNFEARSFASKAMAHYMPLGVDLVCGLADPTVLGLPMILIRRSVFEAVGGYREVRGAAHEDWELLIRLTMAGYKVDVLPEYLLYFRRREGGLSQTSTDYEAKRRLIDTYEDQLAKVGLRGFATSLIALLQRRRDLEAAFRDSRDARTTRLHGLVGEMLRRKSQR